MAFKVCPVDRHHDHVLKDLKYTIVNQKYLNHRLNHNKFKFSEFLEPKEISAIEVYSISVHQSGKPNCPLLAG